MKIRGEALSYLRVVNVTGFVGRKRLFCVGIGNSAPLNSLAVADIGRGRPRAAVF